MDDLPPKGKVAIRNRRRKKRVPGGGGMEMGKRKKGILADWGERKFDRVRLNPTCKEPGGR